MDVISSVGGVFGILQGAHKMVVEHQQRRALVRNALRMLAVEVEHNVTVLDACHIYTKRGPSGTDPGYMAVARALRTGAHLALLMVTEFEDEEQAVLEHQGRLDAIRQNLFDVPLTIDVDGIETHVRLGDAVEAPGTKRKLDESKPVGLLEASAFVVSRVGALVALADTAEAAGDAMKTLRPKTRLKTIRAYERTIQRELKRLDVVPRIRLESKPDR